jgi:hypothetical protein
MRMLAELLTWGFRYLVSNACDLSIQRPSQIRLGFPAHENGEGTNPHLRRVIAPRLQVSGFGVMSIEYIIASNNLCSNSRDFVLGN